MSRDYRLYLDDIQSSTEKILRYTQGLDFGSFTNDAKTSDAVMLNLQIIGEAVKNIPSLILSRQNILRSIGVGLLDCAM
jgi:uncharacterized protein with HEPN domain